MAANLTTPAEFQTSKPNLVGPQLIPPSQFELPAWPPKPTATSEVLTLKQENEKLKQQLQAATCREESKPRSDVPQPAPALAPAPQVMHLPNYQSTHLEDMINRQASELGDLRKKLSFTETSSQRQIARLESQLMMKDAQHDQKVAALQREKQEMADKHEQQVSERAAQYEHFLSECQSRIQDLEEEVDVRKAEYEASVAEARNRAIQAEDRALETQQQMQAAKRDMAERLKGQGEQISQLQQYLTESQAASQSNNAWRREVDALKEQLQLCEKEKKNSENSLNLLSTRLSSQNELMALQEKELSKVPETASSDKKRKVLLTRWREKVFEQLIQMKSAELVAKEQDKQWMVKIHAIEAAHKECEHEREKLTHGLADAQAQLALQYNQNKVLEEELGSAQQLAIHLDAQLKQQQQTVIQLTQYAHSVNEKYAENLQRLDQVGGTLKAYQQRIAFASGRIEMLQGQFARKEALIRLELEEKMREVPTKDEDQAEEIESECHASQLRSELIRVTKERDQLAEQIRQDAGMLDDKVQAAREQVSEEVRDVHTRLQQLHEEMEELNQRKGEVEEELEREKRRSEQAEANVKLISEEMERLKEQMEMAVSDAFSESQSKYTEQLADMERQLNEAKREQAKAVVSLRQLERQTARDKERTSERIQVLEEQHRSTHTKLNQQLKDTQAERNLLMTTLRQEGLIGKFQAARGTPAQLSDAGHTPAHPPAEPHHEPSAEYTVSQANTSDIENMRNEQEEDEVPLHTVIDDLKSLTAAVLDDDDSED